MGSGSECGYVLAGSQHAVREVPNATREIAHKVCGSEPDRNRQDQRKVSSGIDASHDGRKIYGLHGAKRAGSWELGAGSREQELALVERLRGSE